MAEIIPYCDHLCRFRDNAPFIGQKYQFTKILMALLIHSLIQLNFKAFLT